MADGATAGAWTWSDAWILASLTDGRRGMSLSELIGSADAHNHAIPTRDELAAALGGLVAAGLVENADHRFRVTSEGKALKKHWKGGMFAWSESLLPHLQRLPKVEMEYPLTEEDVDQAYAEYQRRF